MLSVFMIDSLVFDTVLGRLALSDSMSPCTFEIHKFRDGNEIPKTNIHYTILLGVNIRCSEIENK